MDWMLVIATNDSYAVTAWVVIFLLVCGAAVTIGKLLDWLFEN